MNDKYEEWLLKKSSEAKTKQAGYLPGTAPNLPNETRQENIRIWWAYEARARAYEDSLIQYRLMKVSRQTRSRSYDLG